MVYVSGGQVLSEGQSPWRLTYIPELFWGFINFIVLFFQTLFNPNLSKRGSQYTTDYRSGGGRGPPPPPRRRIGGFRGGAGAPSAPPPAGGG